MVADAVPPAATAADVRAQIAEQLARYRAEGGHTGAYDEVGRPTGGYYDELVDTDGVVRQMWSELSADFVEIGPAGLGRLDTRVRRLIDDDGITYTEVMRAGEAAIPTPWRLDPIPLLVSADDWTRLEAGLVQRSRVLDEVLTDIYGSRRTITSGLLPPELVFGNVGYVRAAHGITIPGRHQLFLHACDISRWSDGEFRAIADWAQAPSGAGYALADRRVVSTAIPEAFEHSSPRPLTPFARAMRLLLIEAAPVAEDNPVVVVLSPGVHSETAFDQAYLASTLGFPLVESADLVVRDGALWMRSLGTLKRVDVVLRRVDAEFSDPLDLRPDSHLGVVGLVEVLRRGAVTVVNTLGSGLLENPALAGFLPRISRALLGEELLLDSAPAYWGGDASERSHLLAELDQLIIRSTVDGATLFGPDLSATMREELRRRIEADGWKWVGQEPAQFSVAPAVHGYGGLAAAPVGMRLFSLARRGGYTAMAGGLGQLRQRTQPDRAVIKIAAKDVWVRAAPATTTAVGAEAPREERERRVAPIVEEISSPRVLTDMFWMGRYCERAEAAVRLLIATHDRYQDYRYRPWLEGAEALPVLMAALAATTCTAAPDAVIGDGGAKLESRGGEPGSGGGAPEATSAGGEPKSGGGEPQALGGEVRLGGRESESGREDQGSDDRKLGPGSGESGSGGGEPEALGGGPGLGGAEAESGREDQGSDDRKLRPGSGEPGSGGGEIEALGGGPGLGGAEAESGRGDLGSGGGKPGLGGGKPGLGGGKLGRGGAKPEPRGGESRAFGGGLGPGGAQVESGGGKQREAGGAEPASGGEMGSGGAESELGGAADGFTAASASEGNGGVAAVAGASREGHDYLEALTIDRELPGSLAYAIDRYGSSARAVRDQLSHDTWMILGSVDRALAEYRESDGDETALSAVHSLTLAALLSLSGIEAESLVRDIGWCVMDIGKRIERGLAVTALLSSALTETYPAEAELVVTEAVLQAAESSVSYRRRHRDSVRVSAVAGLLLFDRGNPRSLAYQLERLDANFAALPGASGSSRPQRLLADAQRMLRRVDPDDLNVTDENGRRTELAELLDGVHLRLRKVAESFETTKLSLPVGIQPLWGSTRVVG